MLIYQTYSYHIMFLRRNQYLKCTSGLFPNRRACVITLEGPFGGLCFFCNFVVAKSLFVLVFLLSFMNRYGANFGMMRRVGSCCHTFFWKVWHDFLDFAVKIGSNPCGSKGWGHFYSCHTFFLKSVTNFRFGSAFSFVIVNFV